MKNSVKAIIFDLGNTLIEQRSDLQTTLDQMELRLMPHVKPTLEFLSTRYQMGLLTDTGLSDAKHVWDALQNLSIANYFSAVVTSFDVGVQKPDLRMFEAILRALSVRPEQCLMVGNDLRRDIAPALRLGMRAAYFSGERHSIESMPCLQLSSFSDLPRMLSELEGRENDAD